MRTRFAGAVAGLAVLLGSWSCAGDGTGLDEFGNPMGQIAALGPTLAGVQDNIFTPICTRCHTGASAPLGLVLDEGVAYANLVGVQSVEVALMDRVSPGQPEASYIVWKIEGRSGIIGGRMPLGLDPLSAEQIAAIRGWIQAGAPSN